MTQMDLSRGLCTPSMISQIESDRARPSYKVLFAIAERLDVSLDKLLADVNLDMEYTSKYKMALALVQAREYASAIPLLEELLGESRTQVPETETLFELGICYLETGRVSEASVAFAKVSEQASEREDVRLMVSALIQLGAAAEKDKELQLAIYHTQRALEEYRRGELCEPQLQARALYQIAALSQAIGKVDEAARYYADVLACYEGISDLDGIGRTYLRLSETYQKAGDFEKSGEYAMLALAILKTRNHLTAYRDVQRQLILLERHEKSWETAVLELKRFAAQYEEQDELERAGETYADIAEVYLENDMSDEAMEAAREAIRLMKNKQRALGKAHQVLSFVQFRYGCAQDGRVHYDEAMSIYESLGLLAELEELTLSLCQYLDEQGQYQEAFKRLEKYHDILHNKLRKRGIAL